MPKLDAYKPLIDQWRLDDRKAPRKQRHTAKRCLCGFRQNPGTSTALTGWLPSTWPTGNHRCILTAKGPICLLSTSPARVRLISVPYSSLKTVYPLKKSIWCFLSFPFSNAGYLQLMYGENIECFMEGMIDIFAHLGGVPSEIWFDNTSILVTKILKDGGRQLTDKFLRFSVTYLSVRNHICISLGVSPFLFPQRK